MEQDNLGRTNAKILGRKPDFIFSKLTTAMCTKHPTDLISVLRGFCKGTHIVKRGMLGARSDAVPCADGHG